MNVSHKVSSFVVQVIRFINFVVSDRLSTKEAENVSEVADCLSKRIRELPVTAPTDAPRWPLNSRTLNGRSHNIRGRRDDVVALVHFVDLRDVSGRESRSLSHVLSATLQVHEKFARKC